MKNTDHLYYATIAYVSNHSCQGNKWVTLHMDVCEQLGLTWPPPVPAVLKESPWIATVPSRESEILSIALAVDTNHKWADTSQMVSRARFSCSEMAPTVTPGCHLFNFDVQRYLTGRDLLCLQGYPYEALPGAAACTDIQLSDLAGNAFSTSVICALDVALLLSTENINADDGTNFAVRHAMAISSDANSDVEFDLA